MALCARYAGPCRIDFEITETAILRDLKQANQSLLTLLGHLPPAWRLPVVVVLHLPEGHESRLPALMEEFEKQEN